MEEYIIVNQRNKKDENISASREISSQLGISLLTARLLSSRGFASIDAAEAFLNPKREHLHSETLLPGIKESTERIHRAASLKEKITVIGDYDCDGVCAAAILVIALRKLSADVSTYLPDRFTDGYGLNKDIISRLISDGTQLIITADNGITAAEEIRLASESGIDVIVTDHHICGEVLPPAYSIINPKLPYSQYPYDELCAASIAFKLALSLCSFTQSEYDELTAIAALATVADVVPLTGENRVITSLGIKALQKNANIGIKNLAKAADLDAAKISSGNISFQLAPRLNAAGRLEKADLALDLLLAENDSKAQQTAEKLSLLNAERQKIEKELTDRAEEYIRQNSLLDKNNILFAVLENAHEGVIGIAAGKLAEKYKRPAVVGSRTGSIIKASARSIPSFDIHKALSAADCLFERFGGHSQAAGFSIREENYEEMTKAVSDAAVLQNVSSLLYKHAYYDIEAELPSVSLKTAYELEKLAPFGAGNPKPVIKTENVQFRNIKKLGANKEHISFTALEGSASAQCIGFFMPSLSEAAEVYTAFDILYCPSVNEYRNNSGLQLEIREYMPAMECPKEYPVSLYSYFQANLGTESVFSPPEIQMTDEPEESVLDSRSDCLFILYGRDSLMRVLRYCSFRQLSFSLHFGTFTDTDEPGRHILVNPVLHNLNAYSGKIIVLDKPCFYGYEKRLYDSLPEALFLKSAGYIPETYISRDYIAYIYKKTAVLQALGNDIFRFIDHLNSTGLYRTDYFRLLVSLDIMSDLGIIYYEVSDDKINVTINNLTDQKDLNDSFIMLELKRCIYE